MIKRTEQAPPNNHQSVVSHGMARRNVASSRSVVIWVMCGFGRSGSRGSLAGVARHDQAGFVGRDHRLRPVAQAELAQDPADVVLVRLLPARETLCDLAVGQPLGHETEHW